MQLAAILLPLLLAAGCAASANPPSDPRQERALEIVSRAALENTEFALDLYEALRQREGNLFLAPQSISAALAMTFAGARGETAGQMARVMHFGLEGDSLHRALGQLLAAQRIEQSGACELYQANALWGQRGYGFLDTFTDLLAEHYDAPLQRVDFAEATEAARTAINDWIAAQTRERIKELLQEGDVDPATALVLTSAVYFKGAWATQFDPARTYEAPFHVGADDTVQAQMMATNAEFRYADVAGVQVLDLPYDCGDVSMCVLLPADPGGLAALEASLTTEKLEEYLNRPRLQPVRVELPRFSLSTRFDLAETLSGMGMPAAFAPGSADFSGMTGGKDLFISAVITEANVDVTEEGTEAAGATAVTMKRTSMPPSFRADHPFVFVIHHKPTGAILFLGRVADPTAR